MSVHDRAAIRAFLAERTGNRPAAFPEQRRAMDAVADTFPTAPGTRIERTALAGVEGEWVKPGGVREDAVLLYLHGGGYCLGSPRSHRHLVEAAAREAGISAFAADYRLAPENPFPAAVEDGVAAYRGLLEGGIDAKRLAVAGDSAGGGLTVATLLAAREKGLPMPAAAVCISPWCDLSNGGQSYRARAGRDPMITKDGIDNLAAAYLNGADARNPLASPAFAKLDGLPPLLIQVGTEEVLYDDAVALRTRAEEAGVETSFEAWGGMPHVWHFFHPILSEGRDAISRLARFVKARIA